MRASLHTLKGDLELIAASRPVLSRRPYIPRAAWPLQPSRAVPIEAGLRGAAPRENLLSAHFISQGLDCFGCHLCCSPAWICTRTGVLACHVIQHAAHLTSGYQQYKVAVAVKSTHAELFSRCPAMRTALPPCRACGIICCNAHCCAQQ